MSNTNIIKINRNTNKDFILNMNTKTWTRDSHGLFDYETSQLKPHEGNIFENAFLTRKKMDIKLFRNLSEINNEEEILLKIKAEKCKKKNKINKIIKVYYK